MKSPARCSAVIRRVLHLTWCSLLAAAVVGGTRTPSAAADDAKPPIVLGGAIYGSDSLLENLPGSDPEPFPDLRTVRADSVTPVKSPQSDVKVVCVIDPSSVEEPSYTGVPSVVGSTYLTVTTDSQGSFYFVIDGRLAGHRYAVYVDADRVTGSHVAQGVLAPDTDLSNVIRLNLVSRLLLASNGAYTLTHKFETRMFVAVTDRVPADGNFTSGIDTTLHVDAYRGFVGAIDGECDRMSGWACTNNGSMIHESFVMERNSTSASDADPVPALVRSLRQARSRDVLLYVHGFNQSYRQAQEALARLAFEVDWEDRPALVYSWPSRGDIRRYTADSDVANSVVEQEHFVRFLRALAAGVPGLRLHIVAHSMGNRLVFHALTGLPNAASFIASLDSFAADTLPQDLDPVAGALRSSGVRQRVYYSHNDLALRISACKNAAQRLGLGRPTFPPGVSSYDASTVASTDGWGHGYFANTVDVAIDLNAHMNGAPTALSPRLREASWLGRRASATLTMQEALFESGLACTAVNALEF